MNPDGSQLLLLNGGRYHVEIAVDSSESTARYYSIAGQRPAMRNNDGSINYLLGDHLGSVSTVVNASGEIISQSRYLPFGELLWSDGASPTDYTYTGQRSLSDIGLMDYNARFYDPMLGRFTSPDSIIPDPGSVIGYNRFTYVNNNPVRYSDPSGHCIAADGSISSDYPFGTSGLCSGESEPDLPIDYGDIDYTGPGSSVNPEGNEIVFRTEYPYGPDKYALLIRLRTGENTACNESNLVWCFYNRGLLSTGTYQITSEQMRELMEAVYLDVHKRTPALMVTRYRYDTVFWDEYGKANSTICVDNAENCYQGIEVNYFAQGMISAKFGGYDNGIKLVEAWKSIRYDVEPSDGTIFWFTEGYEYYLDHTK